MCAGVAGVTKCVKLAAYVPFRANKFSCTLLLHSYPAEDLFVESYGSAVLKVFPIAGQW